MSDTILDGTIYAKAIVRHQQLLTNEASFWLGDFLGMWLNTGLSVGEADVPITTESVLEAYAKSKEIGKEIKATNEELKRQMDEYVDGHRRYLALSGMTMGEIPEEKMTVTLEADEPTIVQAK